MMQLQPGEKSILAYFSNETKAETAHKILKEQGFTDIQLDRVSSYPNSRGYGNNRSTLSTMILGNGAYDGSPSPLLAADPSASGMAGSHDLPGQTAFLLAMVCSAEESQAALKILRENEARV